MHGHRATLVAYIISFIPYYWRTMQCLRRYIEEGYDPEHLANGFKYMVTMLAAFAKWNYGQSRSPRWLTANIIVSAMATVYQTYWDIVKDWGLLQLDSKNMLLRDELILKDKRIYYASIVMNLALRLVWIETVVGMGAKIKHLENTLIVFIAATLEIIRRGMWNFYRLENEHLNNVGHFRAVKHVPLPFDLDDD